MGRKNGMGVERIGKSNPITSINHRLWSSHTGQFATVSSTSSSSTPQNQHSAVSSLPMRVKYEHPVTRENLGETIGQNSVIPPHPAPHSGT